MESREGALGHSGGDDAEREDQTQSTPATLAVCRIHTRLIIVIVVYIAYGSSVLTIGRIE